MTKTSLANKTKTLHPAPYYKSQPNEFLSDTKLVTLGSTSTARVLSAKRLIPLLMSRISNLLPGGDAAERREENIRILMWYFRQEQSCEYVWYAKKDCERDEINTFLYYSLALWLERKNAAATGREGASGASSLPLSWIDNDVFRCMKRRNFNISKTKLPEWIRESDKFNHEAAVWGVIGALEAKEKKKKKQPKARRST